MLQTDGCQFQNAVAMSIVAQMAVRVGNGVGVVAPGEMFRESGGGGAAVPAMEVVGADGIRVAAASDLEAEAAAIAVLSLIRSTLVEASSLSLLAVIAATATARSVACSGGLGRPRKRHPKASPLATTLLTRSQMTPSGDRLARVMRGTRGS